MVPGSSKERWEPSPKDTMPYPGRNVSSDSWIYKFVSTLTVLSNLHVL
jgi:hypothetical protein